MRILLVDDHNIVRMGVRGVINAVSGWEVVGEAENGLQAVEMVAELAPDLVVMDISMPEMDGVEAAHAIRTTNRDVKILILTMLEDEHFLFDALSADINGYIFKMAGIQDIQKAIQLISQGDSYFDPKITKIIIGRSKMTGEAKQLLSERELEVLQRIVGGSTSVEIGEQLFISQFTVQKHRKNILKKLNVKGTAELVKCAIERKLV